MFILLFIFRFLKVLLYSKHITEVIMHITLPCIILGSRTRVGYTVGVVIFHVISLEDSKNVEKSENACSSFS